MAAGHGSVADRWSTAGHRRPAYLCDAINKLRSVYLRSNRCDK